MDQERFEAEDVNVVQRAKNAINDRVEMAKSAAQDAVSDNPMLMLLGGLAVGFIVGMFVPVSRFENERLGPVADDLKGRVREAGAQAVRRGAEAIKESIGVETEV